MTISLVPFSKLFLSHKYSKVQNSMYHSLKKGQIVENENTVWMFHIMHVFKFIILYVRTNNLQYDIRQRHKRRHVDKLRSH